MKIFSGAGFILIAVVFALWAFALHPSPTHWNIQKQWELNVPAAAVSAAPPQVTAKAAFLADASTGQELFSLNPDLELPPASTTKIVTATLAIEHGNLDRVVCCSDNACAAQPANIAMKPGEQITLRELLYAMMIHSANDAAIAVAEAVGASEPTFINLMNAHAKKLGCAHTHFVTPNGLFDPQHYSTARDLATFTEYALKLPLFNQLIETRKHLLVRSINQKFVHLGRSHGDRFLFKYNGADGVKTGYTHQSGRCYVASATHADECGPWRLVSVTLHAKDTYHDSAAMMDYGFKAYRRQSIVKKAEVEGSLAMKGSAPAQVITAGPLYAVVKADQPHVVKIFSTISASPPVAAGDRVGWLTASVDGGSVQRVALTAKTAVPEPSEWFWLNSKRWILGMLALAALACSYGTLAKNNRRSRVVFAPSSRGLDTSRPSHP